MADRLTSSELESMKKSVDLMTDLSKNLRNVFSQIKNETNLIGVNFRKIVSDASKNNNLAERYLIAQRTTAVLSAKINELKSKSSYLDETSLRFKKQEALLQNEIGRQNIELLEKAINTGRIDTAEGLKRIETLKMQRLERAGELLILNRLNGVQNNIVNQLEQQLTTIEGFTPSLTGTLGKFTSIKDVLKSIGAGALKDFGKLGEYLKSAIEGTLDPLDLVNDYILVGFNNFKSFDAAASKARQSLGLLPGQANLLEKNLKRATLELMHLGATFEDVGKSIDAISNELTGLLATDLSLLKTTTSVAKQFGISETTSVKFLKTLGGISDSSTLSQQSMIGFAQKISAASKVPLDILMKDVAEASDDVRVYVGNSSVALVKAAAAARMMGIDLNKAASSAEKLLQFESSIGAELKASALLGQNINFNYARQLFFNKNIIGGNKEILRIAKQVRFNQLNPIQQKAFADAAGKSVSELQDMFQQEKNIALVKNSTNKEAIKAYAEYERLMQLKDKEVETEGDLALKEMVRRNNQERLLQIQNRFNKLMSELAEPVMDVTERLLDIAIKILPPILNAIKYMTPIVGVFKTVYKIGDEIRKIGNSFNAFISTFTYMRSLGVGFFTSIENALTVFNTFYSTGQKITTTVGILQKSIGFIATVSTKISSIFTTIGGLITKIPLLGGPLIKVLGIFGKFLGPLGVVINIFTFLSSLMKRWEETPKGFLGGLQAIGGALYDTLVQPFINAYNSIASLFVAKSPSKLGLGIVRGISSIGTMLFDVLISPFKLSYNLIIDLFKNIGEPILNGLQSIGSSVIDILTSPFKSSFNWIMDNLGGKSPSKIGLGILDGITSIQSKLFENITNPFNNAFKSITNLVPTDLGSTITVGLKDGLMSAIDPFKSSLNAVFLEFGEKLSTEIASSIAKGIKSSESVITESIKTNISDIKLPVTEFTVDSVEKSTAVKKIETTTSPLQQVIEVSNQQLVQKLDQLITLMSNGGIAVNLDGQLVSRGLATSTYKSGGFGQSTTRA